MPYTTHVESGKGNSLIFVGGVREPSLALLGGPSTSLLDRMNSRHRFIQCCSENGRVAVLAEFELEDCINYGHSDSLN